MTSTLATYEIGEGLPILILHGWQMRKEVEIGDFEPVFAKISNLHRIYVDLPGMGASSTDGIQSLDDIYSRLVQFIDQTLGEQRFLLVGSSCGGYLARALAYKYRGQVDGLLLRMPLIEADDAKRDLDVIEPLLSDKQVTSKLSTEDRTMLGDVLIQTPTYVEALRARYTEVFVPAVEAADKAVLEAIRADPTRYKLSIAEAFEQVEFTAPTLIVTGRHDATVGYRDSLRLLELYPRSTHIVIDRGTHDFPIDQLGFFEVLVQDWIVRVLEWRSSFINHCSSSPKFLISNT